METRPQADAGHGQQPRSSLANQGKMEEAEAMYNEP